MPVSEIRVTQFYRAVQYDGTNAEDIAEWIAVPTLTVSSVVSGVATFLENGESERIVHPGEYIVGVDYYGTGLYLTGNYASDDFEVIWTRLDAPSVSISGFGVATVPTLLLNGSTTVSVTVSPPQSSETYDTSVYLVGDIGPLVIIGTSIVDEHTVDVTVQAQGLAYVSGAQLVVTTSS